MYLYKNMKRNNDYSIYSNTLYKNLYLRISYTLKKIVYRN